MDIVLLGAAFGISLACAVVMGFAIQRGATCTVIAVAEVVNERRFLRLASMIEASLWVLAGLLVAQALHLLRAMPPGYAITAFTVLGGVLLGIGAYVNGACVFGAIARLGSGEWSYVATPLGFYLGCVALGHLRLAAPPPLAHGSPILTAPPWIALALTALLVVRLVVALARAPTSTGTENMRRRLSDAIAARVWSAHAATIVIGISFFVMLLLVGAWSYTDALADLARGMAHDGAARTVLLMGLLSGAVLGGFTAKRLRHTRVTASRLARCFIGGALMAWGTVLIPGGNDGLILVGIPLLWPYAWLAFLTMCVTIGIAQLVENALAPAPEPAATGRSVRKSPFDVHVTNK
jgi:toxin CptA